MNWDEMIINDNARYCNFCSKNVMNFAEMDNNSIIRFILQNKDKDVCGRVKNGIMNFSHEEIIAVIDKELMKNKKTNYGFYLLLVATLSFISCNNTNSIPKSVLLDKQPLIKEKEDSLHCKTETNKIKKDKSNTNYQADLDKGIKSTKGGLQISPTIKTSVNMPFDEVISQNYNNLDTNFIHTNIAILPMYRGGIDKLYEFIEANLVYPKWEKNQKIEGRVIVDFIVEKDGTINNPRILRVPDKSKNLGNESLRLINLMPKWIPGENFNKKVRFRYTMPIIFRLTSK